MKIKILTILFSILFPLFIVVPAFASTSLDSTYGTNGTTITSFGHDASPQKMALQSNGKTVVVGAQNNGSIYGWAIARYNTDGTLDSSFGTNGIATKFFSGNSGLEAVAIQTDGKIVVGGYSYNGTQCSGGNSCWTVARYNADGSLDTSFGSNGGIIVTTIGSSNCCGQDVQALTIQSDGKIIAAGSTRDIGVIRYNTNGSIDLTANFIIPPDNCAFGCITTADSARGIVIQPDGKIVIAGSWGQYGSSNHHSFMLRLNSNGGFDTSFGSGGNGNGGTGGLSHIALNSIDVINDIALQSDGKFLIAGGEYTSSTNTWSTYFARVTASGSLDSTFGNGGVILGNYGSSNSQAQSMLIEPKDNKIIVGGYYGSNLILARYNYADGTVDQSFGTNGIFQPTLGSGSSLTGFIIQSDYKLVGIAGVSNGSYADWGIFRTSPVVDTIQIAASPSTGTFNVDAPTTIIIQVTDSNPSNPFNAAAATVTMSSNLTVTGINNPVTNSCNFNFTQSPTKSDPSFAGAIYNGSKTNCTVYTMTVTPNATGTGTVTITNGQIKAYADSSEIITGVQNGSYTINAAVPTPTPAGTTLVTIDDSIQGSSLDQWNYVGSGWSHCTDNSNPACNPNLYNNSVSWDNTTDDYATITFNGRQIILYGLVDPNHGIAGVSIDGGSETNVDFYSSTRQGNVKLWTSPLLALGQHTFKIRVTGNKNANSGGTWLALDRADNIQNSPSNIAVTNTVFVTYGPTFTITGTRDSSITHVFVNGSESGVTYPTSTTWKAIVNVSLGNNNFTIYGKDDSNNQTASIPVTVNMHKLGDINGDNLVDLTDASLFAVDYGKTDPSTFTYPLSDMNNDGRVDLQDLSILAKNEQ